MSPLTPLLTHTLSRNRRLTACRTDTGTAKLAGIELTLLDCARWLRKAGGMSRVAQIAQQARTTKLLDPTSQTHAGEFSGRRKITVNWPR